LTDTAVTDSFEETTGTVTSANVHCLIVLDVFVLTTLTVVDVPAVTAVGVFAESVKTPEEIIAEQAVPAVTAVTGRSVRSSVTIDDADISLAAVALEAVVAVPKTVLVAVFSSVVIKDAEILVAAVALEAVEAVPIVGLLILIGVPAVADPTDVVVSMACELVINQYPVVVPLTVFSRYMNSTTSPAYHDVISVFKGLVGEANVPATTIVFAPVEFTLRVGLSAELILSNLTRIVAPTINVSKAAQVTTLAAVLAAVSHVPYRDDVIKPVVLEVSLIFAIYAIIQILLLG
jgi:hypothetical protein